MIQKVYETSWGHNNKVNLVKFWTCILAGGLLHVCDRMIPYCGAVGKVGYLLKLHIHTTIIIRLQFMQNELEKMWQVTTKGTLCLFCQFLDFCRIQESISFLMTPNLSKLDSDFWRFIKKKMVSIFYCFLLQAILHNISK